jgi:hypothetical protein
MRFLALRNQEDLMPALVRVNGEPLEIAAAVHMSILQNGTVMEQLVDKLMAEAKIEYPVFEEEAVRSV